MSDLASAVFSVVMVGHSLFGQTGPDMLQNALSATSGGATVEAQIINGAPLRYSWEKSDTAEGIDARMVLPQGKTTDLILTEALPLANHLKWSETGVYADAFARLALAANPGARVFVQETWHSLNSGTGTDVPFDDGADVPWRARLLDDLDAWENIVDLLRNGHPEATDQIKLIPAGQALARLDDAIGAGRVPGLSDISDVFDDDIHLNTRGHYFVSMVQYAVLTGADPAGLPHDVSDRFGKPFDGVDATMAAVMQEIAKEAVEAYQGGRVSGAASGTSAPVGARAPPVPTVKVLPTDTPMSMAVGLAPVTDWSAQQPFLDVMRTARPWLGHLPGRFGGIEYAELVSNGHIDADGWVTSLPRAAGSVGTLILTDQPEAAVSLKGRYVLRFEGSGVVEPLGRAGNIRYGHGEVRFDYTPGPGSVEIRIQRTSASNPVRRISVVREDRLEMWEGGAVFNPDFLRRLDSFDTLRFMDWMETNNSVVATWEARPRVSDASWAHHGVPLEVMVSLANTLGAHAWVNMPHLADDAYVRAFAGAMRAALDTKAKVFVEYSNEVWNFQFAQTRWADAQAQARWGQNDVGTQYYALRAAQIARLWSAEYEGDAQRLVNVISSQTGWLGLEENILRAPLVVAEGAPAPFEAFDAYAITGYFGGILGLEARRNMVHGWLDESLARAADEAAAQGLTGSARQKAMDAAQYDYATAVAAQELTDGSVSGQQTDTILDLSSRVWPYHAAVAAKAGLDLIMYEGGTHVVGIGAQVDDARLTAFFHHFNYTPQMGALYTALVNGWRDAGGQLFNAYADVYVPTKWGSWGALRHLDDENSRWDALTGKTE